MIKDVIKTTTFILIHVILHVIPLIIEDYSIILFLVLKVHVY